MDIRILQRLTDRMISNPDFLFTFKTNYSYFHNYYNNNIKIQKKIDFNINR